MKLAYFGFTRREYTSIRIPSTREFTDAQDGTYFLLTPYLNPDGHGGQLVRAQV